MELKMQEGPELIELTNWLLNFPNEYKTPIWNSKGKADFATGQIHHYAIYGDMIRHVTGMYPTSNEFSSILNPKFLNSKNLLGLTLLASYLLFHPWFKDRKGLKVLIQKLINSKFVPYIDLVPWENFWKDSERREEFSRFCLFYLDFFPKGEDEKKALNRLLTVDSVERRRVILETKKAQERAQALREELARKEAEEAASKWTGE
ncbi:MAG: hypothetical protein SFU98_06035 [Leptospiraceae bacterium]|nr:hypothetical protein [Leptospiraceae bacterium]